MSADKYFTPALEDWRIGYEFEIKNSSDPVYFDWEPCVIKTVDDLEISGCIHDYDIYNFSGDIVQGNIRAPYLTKEAIEACGWKDTPGNCLFRMEIKNDGENFEGFDLIPLEEHKIRIIHYEGDKHCGGGEETLYEGFCPSVNELKLIMKLTGINKQK